MTKGKQVLFLTILLASCVVLLLHNLGRTGFSVSVIDLLPGNDDETRILRELANGTQGRQLTVRLFSVSGEVRDEAVAAFIDRVQDSTAISRAWRSGQKGLQDAGAQLFRDRYFWMLPDWLEREFPGHDPATAIDARELAERIVDNMDDYLQSPDGMLLVDLIPKDPFLLMDGLDQRMPIKSDPANRDEVFIWVEQAQSPFAESGQDDVFAALASALKSVQAIQQDLRMEFTGVSVFANASKQAIKGEIQRLNLMGILLVLLVSLLAVRNLSAMLRIAAVVAVALLVAATTVVTVFESVHIIALVIGSILTGIAVDYGFHLLLAEENCIPDADTKKAVVAGSLSSALGFLVLIGAPLPFLRQVGVFVGAGLIAALLTAMALRGTARQSAAIRAWKFTPGLLPVWLGPLLLVAAIPGTLLLTWRSNINELEYPLPHLKEIDSRIMQASAPIGHQLAYLVFAGDILAARTELANLDPDNVLIHAGKLLPEYARVHSVHAMFRELGGFREAFVQALERRDYYADAFAEFFDDWESYRSLSVTELSYQEKIMQFCDKLPGPLKGLVHPGEGISWFMVVTDKPLDLSGNSHLVHLDQANMLSRAFAEYGKVMWIFSGICLVVLVISVCVYFHPGPGLAALMIPAIAGLMTSGIIGYLHNEVGLFHLVGALLAFCISLDYGLFAVASRNKGRKLPKSITVSSITTLAVFGVLATSKVPAVSELAVTILLVLGCTLLVILIRWPGQKRMPPAPFELIPHGPAARMVTDILEVTADSIHAVCNPHAQQPVPTECLVEAMAQSAALLLAENKSKGKPRSGMLVVIQSCSVLQQLVVPGQAVEAFVELQSDAAEGLILFSGKCLDDTGNILVTAQFSIFIPPADSVPE